MDDRIIARELLKIATMLMEARVDIQSRYDYWNRTVFDSKLPSIPVKWGRSKRWGGICKGTVNRMQGIGSVRVIEISDFIIDDPKVVDGILLHEMIHAFMYLKGRAGHGWEFDALLREYSNKSGVEIPKTEDMSHFAVPEDMEVKPKGVLVMKSGTGKKGLIVYNLNFFKNSLNAIKGYYDSLATIYRKNGTHMKATFLISQVKDLLLYPEKRSVMQGFYKVPDTLLNEVLNTGQVVDMVTA